MLIGPCARNKVLQAAQLEVRQVRAVRRTHCPSLSLHVSTSYENDIWFTASSWEQCARIQFRCFRCGKGEGDEAKLRRIRIETEQEQARRRDPRAF